MTTSDHETEPLTKQELVDTGFDLTTELQILCVDTAREIRQRFKGKVEAAKRPIKPPRLSFGQKIGGVVLRKLESSATLLEEPVAKTPFVRLGLERVGDVRYSLMYTPPLNEMDNLDHPSIKEGWVVAYVYADPFTNGAHISSVLRDSPYSAIYEKFDKLRIYRTTRDTETDESSATPEYEVFIADEIVYHGDNECLKVEDLSLAVIVLQDASAFLGNR